MLVLSQKQKILIAITATVWTLALVIQSQKINPLSKTDLNISLKTLPNTVRITIDKDAFNLGDYVDTPVIIPVKPGRHKIKIARDGFTFQTLIAEGAAGDYVTFNDIELQRRPGIDFRPIEIVGDSLSSPYFVEVDQGLARGFTPLTSSDIPAAGTHIVEVFPQWPQKNGRGRCSYTTSNTQKMNTPQNPVRIEIKRQGTKLKLMGCDTFKQKNSDPASH